MSRPSSGHAPQELEGLLDVEDVAALVNASARTVYRMVKSGQMPRPIKIGKLNRWRRQDVLKCIDKLYSETIA
jgi:excisionase family DNA binding protein